MGFIGIGLLRAGLVDQVVAFEPEPMNYAGLVRNIRQNGLEGRVFPVHGALTDRCCELEMELSDVNHGDHRICAAAKVEAKLGEDRRATIRVPGMQLDEMKWDEFGVPASARLPSVLWMDVQGFEGHVIRGAAKTLARGIPTVLEISPYCILRAGMSLEDFTQLIQRHWKTYWVARPSRMTPYPVARFAELLEELGPDSGAYTNIVLTP